MTNITILQAIRDSELFGRWFKRNWRGADTWKAWRSFLAGLFGLPLESEMLELYSKHTGRTDAPAAPFREAFVIAGRRSGKSLIAAMVATYLAVFCDYSDVLAPGETGVIMLIASDRRQARVLLGYVNGFFDSIPMLARMVASRLKESIELTNRVRIEIHTSSFRAVRGYTILAAVCDELAYWPSDESANPDSETLTALRPAMATVPGALLLAISSPYSRRGALWEAYHEHYAKQSDVLVWQAKTSDMNPTVSRAVIAAAYLRDHAAAAAEYGAQFRTDVEGFIPLEVVESRVIPSRFELPPLGDVSYTAFVDPSGGQSDSMTLGIAHFEKRVAVLDCLRERVAPFSPEQVVAEFSEVLTRYRVSTVVGDRYGGEWPREQFQKRGIEYRCSEKNRSELYLEFLPAMMSDQVVLLDQKRLIAQLVSLERRMARGGRDSVDHPPGGHDDCANACAGALVEVLRGSGGVLGVVEWLKGISSGLTPDPDVLPARKITSAPPAETPGEACCASPLPQTVAGGQIRCGNCGQQSWPAGAVPRVMTIGPTRGDIVGRGSKFIVDEYSTSLSMAERQKTLSRFRR